MEFVRSMRYERIRKSRERDSRMILLERKIVVSTLYIVEDLSLRLHG